jgi:prepilin-type N-terminal cleavage/methylation domain-containing protein
MGEQESTMTALRRNRANQEGFTLVELLIVAIILAILAAIVVPQFASSTGDAAASALRSDLSGVRSAIDLYTQQHSSTFPGAVASTGGTCTGGTAGGGNVDTQQALVEQLKYYSNSAGQTCSISDTSDTTAVEFPFGPYIKGDLPANPVTHVGTVTIVTTGDLNMNGGGAAGGWRYDTTSGKFIADDTNTDSNNTRFDAY